jgi:mRNA-degrading endonuclease toxin of MazEF toxin-antitoxin module
VPHLCRGQVVEIVVPDPRGENVKRRPVVILTSTEEIPSAETLVGAAISTQLVDPLPPDWIELPWDPTGKAKSGLKKPCVVKCRWLVKIKPQEIVSVIGHLSSEKIESIMKQVTRD